MDFATIHSRNPFSSPVLPFPLSNNRVFHRNPLPRPPLSPCRKKASSCRKRLSPRFVRRSSWRRPSGAAASPQRPRPGSASPRCTATGRWPQAARGERAMRRAGSAEGPSWKTASRETAHLPLGEPPKARALLDSSDVKSWLEHRGRFLVYLVVYSSTRAIYFPVWVLTHGHLTGNLPPPRNMFFLEGCTLFG